MTGSVLPPGLWPVMLTPFHRKGSIDWDCLDALVEWYLENGAAGLFACCLSSEMHHLRQDERIKLCARVVQRVENRVPVVATGNFGFSVEEQQESLRQIAGTGVEAVVLVPNQMIGPEDTMISLSAFCERLLQGMEDMFFGWYECPVPTHRQVDLELLSTTAGSGRFLYMKETSCDLATLSAKVARSGKTPLLICNAFTPSLLAGFQLGSGGSSPIGANYFPRLYSRLWENRNDTGIAAPIQDLLATLEPTAVTNYPLSAKIWLARQGLPIYPYCRYPSKAWTEADNLRLADLERKLKSSGLAS